MKHAAARVKARGRATSILLGIVCLLTSGCNQPSNEGPVSANPYEVHPGPALQPPIERTGQARGVQPVAVDAGVSSAVRPQASAAARPSIPRVPSTPPVQHGGDSAVQRTLPEYSHMARRAAEILYELVEIHIAVDESGDASKHQHRWGELTAAMTALHRSVLASGFPPPEVVTHLKETWLKDLDDALMKAESAVQEHTSVDSGLSRSADEAREIAMHLKHPRDNSAEN